VPDITAINTVLSSLNTLKQMATALIDLRDGRALALKVREFNGVLIDAQTQIFAVNEERSALIERVRDLEKQIADLEHWDAEQQRYELKCIAAGSFAYGVKAAMQGEEPAHHICANCYQHRKKSILQRVPAASVVSQQLGNPDLYFCPECHIKILA